MAAAFCAAPPPSSCSCILKSHTFRRGTCFDAIGFLHRSPRSPTSQRKYAPGGCEVVRLSTRKTCGNKSLNLKAIPSLKESTSRCSCFGSLVDSDAIAASEFISVCDQLLLMMSIFLTYMAGVIPANNSSYPSQKGVLDNNVVVDSSVPSGSAEKNDDHANLNYPWDSVKGKLLNSLAAIEHGSDSRNSVLEFEQERAKRPLSLYAMSEGPKLRLLLASLQWLEQQVNHVLGDTEAVNMEDWLTNLREIIKKFSYPVCMAWLVGELRLGHNKFDEAAVSSMFEKLKGDDTLLQNIKKSGKEDLYVELLYFLRFGSLGKSCTYDDSLFMSHGNSILEDFVITLADGVASLYLELISVDGVLSNEMTSLGMDMCNLSTRAIQKLRNEVALNQWLYQNVEAVVSMYEDRFDLSTLQLKSVEEPTRKQTKNQSWWKKLTLGKSEKISSSLCYIIISKFSMPVKRTKELQALRGWRYYFSLCLELSDISMPLIRAVIDNVSNAISFFLVSLIGRSLGLIYTGIRQSLRWK